MSCVQQDWWWLACRVVSGRGRLPVWRLASGPRRRHALQRQRRLQPKRAHHCACCWSPRRDCSAIKVLRLRRACARQYVRALPCVSLLLHSYRLLLHRSFDLSPALLTLTTAHRLHPPTPRLRLRTRPAPAPHPHSLTLAREPPPPTASLLVPASLTAAFLPAYTAPLQHLTLGESHSLPRRDSAPTPA